jgi:hypothetical protein
MNLTRFLCRVLLIASGCASAWAQTAPLTPLPVVPDPVVPKPFQFNGSQYRLLLPNRPVILRPGGPLTTALQVIPGNKPCAVARIIRPNPSVDPKMIPQNSGSAALPIEAHSHDVTEMNVPAPSCADFAEPQTTIRRVIPVPVLPPGPPPAR